MRPPVRVLGTDFYAVVMGIWCWTVRVGLWGETSGKLQKSPLLWSFRRWGTAVTQKSASEADDSASRLEGLLSFWFWGVNLQQQLIFSKYLIWSAVPTVPSSAGLFLPPENDLTNRPTDITQAEKNRQCAHFTSVFPLTACGTKPGSRTVTHLCGYLLTAVRHHAHWDCRKTGLFSPPIETSDCHCRNGCCQASLMNQLINELAEQRLN